MTARRASGTGATRIDLQTNVMMKTGLSCAHITTATCIVDEAWLQLCSMISRLAAAVLAVSSCLVSSSCAARVLIAGAAQPISVQSLLMFVHFPQHCLPVYCVLSLSGWTKLLECFACISGSQTCIRSSLTMAAQKFVQSANAILHVISL